jgi:hypothetical protein
MSDPRFESVYLEGQPRQSLFRAARDRIQENCGDFTFAGDLAQLDNHDSDHEVDSDLSYWVKEGDQFFPLFVGVNSIGRLSDNTVVLKSDHISRRHCAIVIHRNGNCEVHDIASKNGTILNGVIVKGPTPMKPGDVLNLSNHRVVLVVRISAKNDNTPFPTKSDSTSITSDKDKS